MHAREEIAECAPTIDSPATLATVVYSSVVSTDGGCKALRGSFHGKEEIGHGGVGSIGRFQGYQLRLTYSYRTLLQSQ